MCYACANNMHTFIKLYVCLLFEAEVVMDNVMPMLM
jgi:hypothetical protein